MKQLVTNPLRVIVLMHHECVPPRSLKGHGQKESQIWRTEYDVMKTLRRALRARRYWFRSMEAAP